MCNAVSCWLYLHCQLLDSIQSKRIEKSDKWTQIHQSTQTHLCPPGLDSHQKLLHPLVFFHMQSKISFQRRSIHDQFHLVKTIQQSLETEQHKLELMINRFQASNQGFKPAQQSIKQILSNRGPLPSPGQTFAVRKEHLEHFSIEDLVVEEVNKRRSNAHFE